jgi:hypothetical protein
MRAPGARSNPAARNVTVSSGVCVAILTMLRGATFSMACPNTLPPTVKDHVEVAVNSFGDFLRAELAQQH